VGALRAADGSVIDALAGLGVPVATTNDDALFVEVTGRRSASGTVPGARRVLRGEELAVARLHGHWADPGVGGVGVGSYGAVVGDGSTQALRWAMASLRSLLFVGFGVGLPASRPVAPGTRQRRPARRVGTGSTRAYPTSSCAVVSERPCFQRSQAARRPRPALG
jgi:hypothetical protein